MAALAELGREIGALLDLEPILGEIGERARELLDADTSAVFLEREGSFVPVVALGAVRRGSHGDTITPGEGIIGDLAIRGDRGGRQRLLRGRPRGVQIPGAEEDDEERLMAAPLVARGEVIGVMAVWRTTRPAHPVHRQRPRLPRRALAAGGDRDRERPAVPDVEGGGGGLPQAEAVLRVARRDQPGRGGDDGSRPDRLRLEPGRGAALRVLAGRGDRSDDRLPDRPWRSRAGRRRHRSRGDRAEVGHTGMSRRHHKDGHLVEVEIDIVPLIVDSEHQGYYAIYHDSLSSRRRARQPTRRTSPRAPSSRR